MSITDDKVEVKKEIKEMKKIIAFNPPISWIKETIMQAGTKIGSVHFMKRKDNELRKMSYRLHVTAPSVAKAPSRSVPRYDITKDSNVSRDKNTYVWKKRQIDIANTQMTVLDVNKVVRDTQGNVIGRGAWRCIPLENVTRIVNNGTEYTIKYY